SRRCPRRAAAVLAEPRLSSQRIFPESRAAAVLAEPRLSSQRIFPEGRAAAVLAKPRLSSQRIFPESRAAAFLAELPPPSPPPTHTDLLVPIFLSPTLSNYLRGRVDKRPSA